MNTRKRATTLLSGIGLVTAAFAGAVLLTFIIVRVRTDDLYGRLTQVEAIPGRSAPVPSSGPTVRIVIHRILPDENAVEASVVLSVDSDDPLGAAIARGEVTLAAEVHDGQAVDHFALIHRVRLDASQAIPGMAAVAASSERFLLPALPSLSGYPFDDLRIRPMIIVRENPGGWLRHHTEVEKAVPGRLLLAEEVGGAPVIMLTRSTTEKVAVTVGALLFIAISLRVAYALFATPLSSIGDLIAVAGFLLATAGVRDLLGISRATGIGSLEVLVVGLPLLFLTLALGASTLAGRRSIRPNETSAAPVNEPPATRDVPSSSPGAG